MKILNHTFLKTFTVLAFLLLVSCSNDDNPYNENDPILGTWKLLGWGAEGDYVSEFDSCENVILTFNLNGTGTLSVQGCDYEDRTESLIWKLDGVEDTYKIKRESDTEPAILIATFPENKMTLTPIGKAYSEIYAKQ